MSEHLVRLTLKDGSFIDFKRDEKKNVLICHEDHCVVVPNASGLLATELFGLIEPLGEITEVEEQNVQ